MITSPSVSALRTSRVSLAWESGLLRSSRSTSSSTSSPGPGKPLLPLLLHPSPPSDPSRQAGRLPIKVLKMLTARSGHILHPEYLQPLPSTPVSPIELDAKKSPLALLAQTCSQIGKPDPPPSSKLSSSSSGTSGDKESKTGPLKLSDIGVEDKSSFKPYSKPSDKKDAAAADNKSGFRVPSATCQPFTPRTGSPSSSASASSPMPSEGKCGDRDRDRDDKKDLDCHKSADPAGGHGRIGGGGITADQDSGCAPGPKTSCSSSDSSPPTSSSSSSVLGCSSGLVAPVSPYKPGQTVFPLPPAAMASYHGSLAGAYHAGYPQHFLSPHGGSGGGLVHGGSLGCGSKAGSSPLAAASPPSLLCRDPYCLSYHCASHLAGAAAAAAASCSSHHDAAAAAAAVLKSQGYPLMYPAHALHASSLHAAASSLHAAPPPPPPSPFGGSGYPLYPYGFVLPNDPLPHVCNWVSANGPCDKRFSGSEELLSHLRTHTADKLMSGYPPGGGGSGSASSSLAAAMACHMHMPGSGGTLALRGPHLGLGGGGGGGGGRYHPYSKSPLPAPGGPVPVPAATGAYYSPYALYGQRLTTASALGYQ